MSTPPSMDALSRLSLENESFFNMTQTVRLLICGRFIIHFLWNKWIFKMTQAVPSSNYGHFIEIFSWKWITFWRWIKPSDPSFVGGWSYIFFEINECFKLTQKIDGFHPSYWWDCAFLCIKTQAKIEWLVQSLHFLSPTFFEIYWCVFKKKKVFFWPFFGFSFRRFGQKIRFLKNEKKFVKNLQKRPFFCSFKGGKPSMSTPRFWRTPFWALL